MYGPLQPKISCFLFESLIVQGCLMILMQNMSANSMLGTELGSHWVSTQA